MGRHTKTVPRNHRMLPMKHAPAIQVSIFAGNKVVSGIAVLDTGSWCSLIADDVADQLGLSSAGTEKLSWGPAGRLHARVNVYEGVRLESCGDTIMVPRIFGTSMFKRHVALIGRNLISDLRIEDGLLQSFILAAPEPVAA